MKREGVEETPVPSLSPPVQKILNTTNKNHNFLSWAKWVSDKSHCLLAKPVLSNARWGWGGDRVLSMLKTRGARNCSATRMPGSPQDVCLTRPSLAPKQLQ